MNVFRAPRAINARILINDILSREKFKMFLAVLFHVLCLLGAELSSDSLLRGSANVVFLGDIFQLVVI